MKEKKTTDKKQCPYCGSNNIHYLGYSRKTGKLLVYDRKSNTDVYDFKCEDCKHIFYYKGAL